MDEEFYPMIQDILDHPVFQKLRELPHHGPDNSVYDHSLACLLYTSVMKI